MPVKAWFRTRQSRKFAGEPVPSSCFVWRLLWFASTSSSARGNGSGRSRTASTMLKIAVFAPMPIAIVSTAMTVKPGDRRSVRIAYLRSCASIDGILQV